MIDESVIRRWRNATSDRQQQLENTRQWYGRLYALMADLRSPQGCPWDVEQSLASLRQYIREEADEVCDAIDDILAYENELRVAAGISQDRPAAPEGDDKARTEKKGHTIAHHPHQPDFRAENSASGAPLPKLDPAQQDRLDALYAELIEEIGDLALQSVFLADILHGMGRPGLDSSLETIVTKLVRRHPHVYGEVQVADSAEVLSNWQDIKNQEKKHTEP